MSNYSIKLSALAAATSLLLTACGGGSSSGGDQSAPPFAPKTVEGVAVDFYVGGATVSFDDCNGLTTTTDDKGKFNFTTSSACNESAITITGGTDLVTRLPFTGTLKLKKTNLQNLASTNLVASPLTTLQYYVTSTQELQTILANLGITNANATNLSTFDPTKSGTAKEMAAVFVLQQLITQIEDNLQALPNSEGNAALRLEETTALAINAVVETLKTSSEPLFDPTTGAIKPALVTAILDTAVEKANEKLVENGETVSVSPQLTQQIQGNIQTVSTALNDVLTTGGTAADLVTAIKSDNTLLEQIQESVKTPVINNFTLASYTLENIKNSSSTSRLIVNRANINDTTRITFTMENISTIVNESAEVGFKVVATRGSLTETLDLYLDKLNIIFNTNGTIQSATIPTGATFKIASSLKGITNGTFQANSSISIGSNGSISLYNMVQNNSALASSYNQYFNLLAAGDNITVTAVVSPRMYMITPNLGLNSSSITIGGTTLNGSALTGHFKLN